MRHVRRVGSAIAIAGVFIAALFLPLSIVGGQLGLLFLMTGVTVAALAGGYDAVPRRIALPVFAFVALSLLSSLSSAVAVSQHGWLASRPVLFAVLVPAALALSRDPARAARRALALFLVAATGAAVLGLAQRSSGYDLNYACGFRSAPIRVPAPVGEKYSAIGFFNSRLTFAAVEAAAVLCALGLVAGARSLWARIVGGAAAVVIGASVMATFARAAWIGVGFGVLTMVAGMRRRASIVILALVLLGAAAAAAVPGVRARAVSAVQTTANPERLFIWSRAGEVLADNPGYGVGMYAYPVIAGPYYDRADPTFPMHTWAHDMFFTVLLETGIAGLIAYLWIFIAVFATAIVALHREPVNGWTAVRLGAIGATASLLGWSLFHDALYDGEVAMTLFFVAGLAAATGRTPAAEPSLAAPDADQTTPGQHPAADEPRALARVDRQGSGHRALQRTLAGYRPVNSR